MTVPFRLCLVFIPARLDGHMSSVSPDLPELPSARELRSRRFGSFSYTLEGHEWRFATQPGVFSQDGLDIGTQVLIETVLPRVKPHMAVLDLGTGVGVVGIALSARVPRGVVWMVDSDVRAIRLAEKNVRANGVENAHPMLSDITLDLPEKLRFDLVVSNPPTHSGKEVLAAFVDESYAVLRPGGSLYVVVNRLLSVRGMMRERFGNVSQPLKRGGFLILASEKRRRPNIDTRDEA